MAIQKNRMTLRSTQKGSCYVLVKAHAGSKVGKAICARRVPGCAVRTVPMKSLTEGASFSKAVKRSIDSTKKRGNPVARYDIQSKRAYLEYPDGKKVYVE